MPVPVPILTSPKNSFIVFTESGVAPAMAAEMACCDDGDFCLPVVNASDVKFQVQITFETHELAYAFARGPANMMQLVSLKGGYNTNTTATANLIKNYYVEGLEFIKTITGEKEVTCYWPHALNTEVNDWPHGLACDECFQLAVIMSEDPDNIRLIPTHFGNCMIKKCSTCDTALIDYLCEDDAYGFRYCNFNTATNRVRLPFYISQPQPSTTKKVYVTSKGKEIITSSSTRQTWVGAVDFMPKYFLFALALALEHDTVSITQDDYQGGFRASGSLAIDWTDTSRCVAQASFKGNTTPYDARNTNCKVCADCPDIMDFILADLHYDFTEDKQSFTFTYAITGPSPAFVILEYKLHADTVWTQSIQANISPINILLPLGSYDFRIVPKALNCLPDYSATIESQGDIEIPVCPAPEDVTVYSITQTTAIAQWDAVLPTPAGLYDWQLLNASMVVVDSGTGYWNPGTLILGLTTGMTAGNAYHFQVRSVCDDDAQSAWSNFDFNTLP